MGDVVRPRVVWAQESSASDPSKNFLSVDIRVDGELSGDIKCELTPTTLHFSSGTTDTRTYELDLEFYAEIDPEKSTQRFFVGGGTLVLPKRDGKLGHWPRLTKEDASQPYIRTDMSRWVEHDMPDEELVLDGAVMGEGLPAHLLGSTDDDELDESVKS
ncbi:hypothetical protein [Streptomyces sp. NPDC002394]